MVVQQKRWVFVTGGSRGIGYGIVKKLASSGYDVIFSYRNSSEQAQALCQELTEQGVNCQSFQCDAANIEQVNTLAQTLISRFGAPYAVINNAGIVQDNLFIRMNSSEWQDVINNNISSAFFVSRAFLPEMIAQGDGVILFMSSVTAFKGNGGQVNYAATKAALLGITKSLAVELGRFNLRVNAIAPGLIDTDMSKNLSEITYKKMLNKIPLGRIGHVDDIACAVTFLLGQGGNYITGQTFVIDGGLTA